MAETRATKKTLTKTTTTSTTTTTKKSTTVALLDATSASMKRCKLSTFKNIPKSTARDEADYLLPNVMQVAPRKCSRICSQEISVLQKSKMSLDANLAHASDLIGVHATDGVCTMGASKSSDLLGERISTEKFPAAWVNEQATLDNSGATCVRAGVDDTSRHGFLPHATVA